MAAADISNSPFFGAELKVSLGIEWLDDIQSFYRERSAIEKEYAQKIIQLCRRHHERCSRKFGTLSVGETPTMTPGSLINGSLETWRTQLVAVEKSAQDREEFAGELVKQVADPMRWRAMNFEELRKAHANYANTLEKERDDSYADLKKTKDKYDAVCQELENKRSKAQSAYDRGKDKAQMAFQQQMEEMNNMKNTYLIAINVTNKLKERYYNEYLPEVIDGLQVLNESRVSALNGYWTLAMKLEKTTLEKNTEQVTTVISEIPRNDPKLDSLMFAQHNIPQFAEPPDMAFIPSPVWSDDAVMVTDESAKVFLMNVLTRSKANVNKLKADADSKRSEVEVQKKGLQMARNGEIKASQLSVTNGLFDTEHQLHKLDRKLLECAAEIAIITATCEMKVPASCPGEMSKEDKKQLKARRQEEVSKRNAAKTASNGDLSTVNGSSENVGSRLTRQNTMTSLSSRTSATGLNRSVSGSNGIDEVISESGGASTARRSMLGPLPSHKSSAEGPFSAATGKMLYTFTAKDPEEVSVDSGVEVTVIEPDTGSGWTRVRKGSSTGLVPTSYLDLSSHSADQKRPTSNRSNASSASFANSLHSNGTISGKRRGPAVAPRRGAKKLQYVIALYDYEARTEAEFSFSEGDRFVLVNRDSGNGWSDVERDGVVKCVPANYVQLC
ncbi:Src-domain containing protein [Ascosphaera apis ARSEF 7405]|uniref:High osmolarity signaling protein SHO1 n=1 Tax=Ascosphaera apis ARSEF 7405 TaxID=392613 RepID=A0A162ICU4_9EURO|nr:Src-domain containing protein [Ascosphaera apis ARSEF 7405]